MRQAPHDHPNGTPVRRPPLKIEKTTASWADHAPTPSVAARIGVGLVALYLCLAMAAAFFARLAQVFELWSEQCAITATQ